MERPLPKFITALFPPELLALAQEQNRPEQRRAALELINRVSSQISVRLQQPKRYHAEWVSPPLFKGLSRELS